MEEKLEKYSIEVIDKNERIESLIGELKKVWEASVRATHHFLSESDIAELKPQAEVGLRYIDILWVVCQKDTQEPVGFMGIQDRKIEMLFLHPAHFRKGLGRKLVQQAFDELDVEYVDVNEQNPEAKRFYERMGFEVFKRNELDSEGRAFPILEMKRKASFTSSEIPRDVRA